MQIRTMAVSIMGALLLLGCASSQDSQDMAGLAPMTSGIWPSQFGGDSGEATNTIAGSASGGIPDNGYLGEEISNPL